MGFRVYLLHHAQGARVVQVLPLGAHARGRVTRGHPRVTMWNLFESP